MRVTPQGEMDDRVQLSIKTETPSVEIEESLQSESRGTYVSGSPQPGSLRSSCHDHAHANLRSMSLFLIPKHPLSFHSLDSLISHNRPSLALSWLSRLRSLPGLALLKWGMNGFRQILTGYRLPENLHLGNQQHSWLG